jgi:hypothetical protein
LITKVFDLEVLQGRKNEDFFYVILGDGTYKKKQKMCTRSCHEVVVNACKLEVLVVDLAQIHHLGTLNNKNTRFGILKNKKLLFRSIASEMKNEPHIFSLLQTSEHKREAN